MSDYVTDAGLAVPSLPDLLDQINQDLRDGVSPLLNTEADGPLGQITGIVAAGLREVWEIADLAFSAFDPSSEGQLLESLCALTGTLRADPTKSRFTGSRKLRLSVDAGTTVPAGSVVYVDGDPETRFVLTETVVASVTDDYLAAAECEVAGPVTANAGTVTEIATPISGWTAVTNPYDAIPGTDQDTDAELRLRREREIRASGSATTEAIRADVLALEDADGDNPISLCTVYENPTDSYDGDGRPPHSIEVLLFDGFDEPTPADDIAQAVFYSRAAGIRTMGTSSGTATDAFGDSHTIHFTRPSYVTIHVEVEVSTTTAYEGDATLKSAIVAAGNAREQGEDVVYFALARTIMSQAGVVDIVSLKVDVVDPPTGTGNVAIGLREMAKFQTGNIDVV